MKIRNLQCSIHSQIGYELCLIVFCWLGSGCNDVFFSDSKLSDVQKCSDETRKVEKCRDESR